MLPRDGSKAGETTAAGLMPQCAFAADLRVLSSYRNTTDDHWALNELRCWGARDCLRAYAVLARRSGDFSQAR